MWSVLTLLVLAEQMDVVNGKIAPCPTGCNCQSTSSNTLLYVDCSQAPPDLDEKQLYHQLDSMLSADNFVEHLTSLSITNTPLTRVPASVCKLLNLTSLNLNNNKLTELPDNCFTKLTKLLTLSIKSNAIVRLQDGLFDGMQSLLSLCLSNNQISVIGLHVFTNSSDLISLRLVDLSHNRLTSLEPWWYYRLILGNKTSEVTVSLNHNLITNFTNKMKFHFRCGMRLVYGRLDIAMNRISHIMDMFNGWNIGRNSFLITLYCLKNIENSHPHLHFNFTGNAYDCDCTDYPLYKLIHFQSRGTMLEGVLCNNSNFRNYLGQQREVITVPLNEFICEQPDGCPSSCRCVYRPANITLHVYCSAADLSSLPLDLPPLTKSYAKYKLDFSNNKLLRRLEHRPYFANTTILDVSNCSLTEFNVDVLKDVSRFSLINLRGNMLQSFPRQTDKVNISAKLLIGDNPWTCSCDNSWMIGWLQSLYDQISDPGNIVHYQTDTSSTNWISLTTNFFDVWNIARTLSTPPSWTSVTVV